jgi:integrase
VVKKGKTPVLTAEEARLLLDSIDTGTLIGLRYRALIAVMTYTFARVGAAVAMRVEAILFRDGAAGCGCMKKGGSAMKSPLTIILIRI